MKKIIGYGLPIVLAAVLVYIVYRDISWQELKEAIGNTRKDLLLFSLLPLLGSHYLRSVRWGQMLKPLGYTPPTMMLYLAVLAGYAANLVVPRSGEILRCTLIQRNNGVPAETSLGNVVAERVIDVLMLLLLTLLGLVFEYDRLWGFLNGLLVSKLAVSTLSTGFVVGFFLGMAALGGGFIFTLYVLRNKPFFSAVWQLWVKLWQGLVSTKDVDNWPLFMLYSVLIWLGYLTSSYMVILAFSPTSELPVVSTLLLNILGGYAMIAPVQGGIGAYHYMVSAGMTAIYALKETDTKSLAFLLHTSQFIVTLVVGGAAAMYLTNKAVVAAPEKVQDQA